MGKDKGQNSKFKEISNFKHQGPDLGAALSQPGSLAPGSPWRRGRRAESPLQSARRSALAWGRRVMIRFTGGLRGFVARPPATARRGWQRAQIPRVPRRAPVFRPGSGHFPPAGPPREVPPTGRTVGSGRSRSTGAVLQGFQPYSCREFNPDAVRPQVASSSGDFDRCLPRWWVRLGGRVNWADGGRVGKPAKRQAGKPAAQKSAHHFGRHGTSLGPLHAKNQCPTGKCSKTGFSTLGMGKASEQQLEDRLATVGGLSAVI